MMEKDNLSFKASTGRADQFSVLNAKLIQWLLTGNPDAKACH